MIRMSETKKISRILAIGHRTPASCWPQLVQLCSFFLVFFLTVLCETAIDTTPSILNFRIGGAIGPKGFLHALHVFNEDKPMVFLDSTGASYGLMFEGHFHKQPDGTCDWDSVHAALNELVVSDRVHFLLGGTDRFAIQEAAVADQAGKIVCFCCVAFDDVFHRGLQNVFGTFMPNSRESEPVLAAMANHGIQQLGIIMAWDHPVQRRMCLGALDYLPTLQLLADVQLAHLANYTDSDTYGDPGWAQQLFERVAAAGVDAVLMCDPNPDRVDQMIYAYTGSRHYLKALWVGFTPAFLPQATHKLDSSAEYVMTTQQWQESVQYADPYFGSAAQYGRSFRGMTGNAPNQFSAGAAATMYVLADAIRAAFSECDVTLARGDVEQLLYNSSAITCPGFLPESTDLDAILTGYELVRRKLEETSLGTFFGRVEFSHNHQNIGVQPTIVQVLRGQSRAVWPLDAATADLVLPIPWPSKHKAWGQQPADIGVIVVIASLSALLLVAALHLLLHRHGRGFVSVVKTVCVRKEDIQVVLEPVWGVGKLGYESGEGIFRASRVSLSPALELLGGVTTPATAKPVRGRVDLELSRASRPTSPLSLAELRESLEPPRPRRGRGEVRHAGPTVHAPQPTAVQGPGCRSRTTVCQGSLNSWSANPIAEIGESLPSTASAGGQAAAAAAPMRTRRQDSGQLRRAMSSSLNQEGVLCADATVMLRQSADIEWKVRVQPWVDTPMARKAVAGMAWRKMQLHHPALSPLLGIVWEWPGMPAPVLLRQQHDMGSLASLLDNSTVHLSLHVKCTIAAHIASAVKYLHAQEPPIYLGVLSTEIIQVDADFKPHIILPLTTLRSPTSPEFLGNNMRFMGGTSGDVGGTKAAVDLLHYGLLLGQLFAAPGDLLDSDLATMELPALAGREINESMCKHMRELEEELLPRIAENTPKLSALIQRCLPASLDPLEEPRFKSFEELEAALSSTLASMQGEHVEHDASARGGVLQQKQGRHNSKPALSNSSVPGESLHGRRSRDSNRGSQPVVNAGTKRKMHSPDDLLFDMFPPQVARALQQGQEVQPERYELVSLFFSDIVGYTDLCAQLQPHEVMDMLNRLYTQFDALSRQHELFKVETIGDAYMAVANLRWPQPETHAKVLAEFALAVISTANSVAVHPGMPELGTVNIRVGLHSGPVVASVVGTLNRRYCLFGDTVNTASRMESNSERNRVHASKAFALLLAKQSPDAVITPRGPIMIKGKGAMETYWVEACPGQPQEDMCLIANGSS